MVLLDSITWGFHICLSNCPHDSSNVITEKKYGHLVEHKNINVFSENVAKPIINYRINSRNK